MSAEFKKSFTIKGMTCVNCARLVERALNRIDGVKFAACNLATSTAFLVAEREIPFEEIRRAVESVGYEASEEMPEEVERRRYREAKGNLIAVWVFTTPLMLLMMHHMFLKEVMGFSFIEAVLGLLVLSFPGRGTLRSALIALRHRHSNMDTLISIGALSAWLTSLLNWLDFPVASFGTIGSMIVAFHLTGRFIESHLRDKAVREIRGLLKLRLEEARVLLNGREVMVPLSAVKEGFLIEVKPGERIPADGVIVEGASSIDESFISGEAIPVYKREGDEVIGGSLNLSSPLRVKVTKVGEGSFLNQMIKLVEEAQGAKIPIQALADRITSWFVPSVFSLALLSAIIWVLSFERLLPIIAFFSRFLPWIDLSLNPLAFSIFVFVATLVIACPCALGLATPMALAVGVGILAKRGLLVKNAEAIQTSKDIGVLLVDKTGTITQGTPVVTYHNLSEEVLKIASSLESFSSHPLARAVASLSSDSIAFKDVREIPGEGVIGYLNGDEYFVGKALDYSPYEGLLNDGKTVVEVRRNGEVIGFLAVEDPLREDSRDAILKLKGMGIRVVMVTGDNEKTALAVSRKAGIEEIRSNVKPSEKLDLVRSFQAEGYKVAMVGDGMNDAAALKGADVGIAMGSGIDLAIEGADIVILKGGVSKVLDAMELSRMIFNVIRGNLFWAFFYNITAIPMAMLGLLHPLIAELAMILSSMTVILNSMRLRR